MTFIVLTVARTGEHGAQNYINLLHMHTYSCSQALLIARVWGSKLTCVNC